MEEDISSNEPGPRNDRGIDPTDDIEVRDYILRQEVTCEKPYDCHKSIGRVLVLDRRAIRHCVGTLVGSKTLMVASSCLTTQLRIPGVDCSQSIHVIFPQSDGHKKLITNCKSIVSSNLSFSPEAALRKSDVTRIELDTKSNDTLKLNLKKRGTRYSRRGFRNNWTYKLWKIDLDKNDKFKSVVRSEKCKALYRSYANPFVDSSSSPFMTFSGCSFKDGNLGAAFTDRNNYIRGLLSSGVSEETVNFLRSRDLLSEEPEGIVHASNLACLFSFKTNVKDSERIKPRKSWKQSCSETRENGRLQQLRAQMLRNQVVHRSNQTGIKTRLEKYERYFRWNIDFFQSKDSRVLETSMKQPKCFFKLSDWIREFGSGRNYKNWVTKKVILDNYHLKVKLNRFLKPASTVVDLPKKEYFVSFSPQDIYSKGRTQVVIRTSLFGKEIRNSYSNVTANCNN